MTALSVQAAVYVLPNVADAEEKIQIAQKNLTFRHHIKTIETLSTGNVRQGDDISGLLYVPQMDNEDPCYYGYVAPNATKLQDLPPLRFDIVGIAPWISRNCTYRYLNSAHDDSGNTKAFILFYPNNTSETVWVEPEPDPDYHALDYSKYTFPVYKIGTPDGSFLSYQMAKYSGNMTEVWDQPELAKKYNATNIARVYVTIDTGARNTLPGVWLFLLVVFGVLVFILGCTSLIMHLTQYRYRLSLQRRVASGEVDLEAMGIKRLTVPKEILSKFPLRIYEHNATPPQSPSSSPVDSIGKSSSSSHSSSSISMAAIKNITDENDNTDCGNQAKAHVTDERPITENRGTRNHAYSQPNCAVCLEDYEPEVTQVRELPCLHIFHPGCIDPHLSTNSSLCPICKASVLPKGFVPPHLTNATVRRERHMRRMRERDISQMEIDLPPATGIQAHLRRISHFINQRFLDTPPNDLERPGIPGGTTGTGSVRVQRPYDLPRSMSFSATPAPTQQEEEEEWRNLSIWSRIIKRIFPR